MITNGKINLVKQLKGLKFRCSDNYKKIIYENIGKIKSATLSKDKAGNFYLSFLIDCVTPELSEPIHESVGLDFGISTYITTSRADEITNLRSTRSNEKKLKRLNQNLSRKEKGSRNKEKARLKLAKAHKKIANRKLTYIHTTTKQLVRKNQVVGIEDLNVGGMMKNHRLARSIQEVSLYETKRQLEYKSRFYGRTLVKVDRFYPSSKLCSGCENKKDKLKLSERVYKCVKCGLVIGRDLNAALNIEKEALRIIKIGNCNPESKPVDSALMDGSEKSLKKSTMYEAGKVK
jgi:putative transposase